MQPLFEHETEFAGRRTRVLELEGHGPPIVLVHGWSDSADTWRHTLDSLGRANRAAIAVDLPGYGKAEPLEDGEILPQIDSFLDAVAKSVGPGAVFVGNSLGGCATMRLAERNSRLGGVVAVAPAGLDMPRWFSVVQRDRGLKRIASLPIPLPPGTIRAGVERAYSALAFAKPGSVDPEVFRAFSKHFPDRKSVVALLDNGRRLLPELSDPFQLTRIKIPLLLVWGTADRMVYPTGAERVLDSVPGSQLILLEGCGHSPQIEEPRKFPEMLLNFAGAGRSLQAA